MVPPSFPFPFPFAFAFALALALSLSFSLFLPLSFLFALLFSLRVSRSSLGFSLLLFCALFPLGNFSALTGNFFLHGLQVGIFLVTLGPSRTDFGSVLLICLCAVDAFFFCSFFADLCFSKFADLLLNCADVNETFEESLSLSVDTRSVQGPVDEGHGFTAVECQKLGWVSLDFLLGNLKHRLCDLLPLVLSRTYASAHCNVTKALSNLHKWYSSARTLASKVSQTCLRVAS
jgi:hypothetical protein